MPRPFTFSFAALACAAFGCAKPAAEAPAATDPPPAPVVVAVAPRPGARPVAPMPHAPRERVLTTVVEEDELPIEIDLTKPDLGLDPKIEATLPQIERLDPATVDVDVTGDPIEFPVLPTDVPGKIGLPQVGAPGAGKGQPKPPAGSSLP